MTDTERFNGLRAWMATLGCCYMCGVGLAIAAVEREARRPKFELLHRCPREGKRVFGRGPDGRSTEHRQTGCSELVRAAWKDRPQRPQESKEAA